MHHALFHADGRKRLFGAFRALFRRNAGIDQRQFHVVKCSCASQQIECLEHESNFFVADARQFIIIQFADQLTDSASTGPSLGESRQPIRFISVDLPEPEGPMIATYSLRWIRRLIPRKAWTCRSPCHRSSTESSVEIMGESGAARHDGLRNRETSAVAILFSFSSRTTCSLFEHCWTSEPAQVRTPLGQKSIDASSSSSFLGAVLSTLRWSRASTYATPCSFR